MPSNWLPGENSKTSRFHSLKRLSRSEEVGEQIQDAITSGFYRSGDRLPSEAELGEAFSVGRSTVREALRGLESIGLVSIRRGLGWFVAESLSEAYIEPFTRWVQARRSEITDLLAIRGALDELAAAKAAVAGDAEAIAAIDQIQREFSAVAAQTDPEPDALVELDVAFHLAIANASGSPMLPDLLKELNGLLRPIRVLGFSVRDKIAESVDQHSLIVEAIKAGDPAMARARAAHHLESATQTLLSAKQN